MRIAIISRASTEIGLGHLVRSRSFAEDIIKSFPEIEVTYFLIAERQMIPLVEELGCKIVLLEEKDLTEVKHEFELVFYDSIRLTKSTVDHFKNKGKLSISLSPVFNQMNQMNLCFSRTKYQEKYLENGTQPTKWPEYHNGLEYAIIQNNCHRIPLEKYQRNLSHKKLSIGISMGGGDASNKALRLVHELKDLIVPATIWVMLGEGYRFSYDSFIEAIKSDHKHEIILARTNQSLWSVLENCTLLITTSGITSYEAAFAGLPSITIYDDPDQRFLIKELLEKKVALDAGINGQGEKNIRSLIEELSNDRSQLLQMHESAQRLIDRNASKRILKTSLKYLEKNGTFLPPSGH